MGKKSKMKTTDQDSAEKQISITEENQILENFDISNPEKSPEEEKKEFSSTFSSYIKSCATTELQFTTLDYTWKIEQFERLFTTVDTLFSPSFGKKIPCVIEINISHDTDNTIKFYLRTSTTFTGICTINIMRSPNKVLSSRSISGRISDMTLLLESLGDTYICTDVLIIHCKFEIFHKLTNNIIHMNLFASSAFKDMTSLETSTLEFKNEKSIKFIIGEEYYVISKKLLYATNSSYFKNICLEHVGKEKDMTNELETNSELQAFKKLLIFILIGSIDQCFNDYNTLKELLTIAVKYDVPDLLLTCEHYLLRYITIENVIELVQLSFTYNAQILKMYSATFIKLHMKEIMKTEEFHQALSQEDLNEIIELIEKKKIFESSIHEFFSS